MQGRFLDRQTRRRMQRRRDITSVVVSISVTLLLAAIILANIFTFGVQIVRYNGQGMEPSLESGQTLVFRKTQNVKTGDIIAFYYNNQILVRRVICEGGNQIELKNDGTVVINGEELQEDYLTEKSMGQCNTPFPLYVQIGYVFVMGDNRILAMDSRLEEIGPVSSDRIIGKLILDF